MLLLSWLVSALFDGIERKMRLNFAPAFAGSGGASPTAAPASGASGVDVPGFGASKVFEQIQAGLAGLTADEKSSIVKKVRVHHALLSWLS